MAILIMAILFMLQNSGGTQIQFTYEFFESIDNNNIFKIDSLNIFCNSLVDSLCIGRTR